MKKTLHALSRAFLCRASWLLAVFVVVLFSGCSHKAKQTDFAEIEEEEVTISHAQRLKIERLEESQYRVAILDDNFRDTLVTYHLVPREIAEEVQAHCQDIVIPIPIRRIACIGSSGVGFLVMLKEQKRVTAVNSGSLFLDDEIKHGLKSGLIDTLGSPNHINTKRLAYLKPDALLWTNTAPVDIKQEVPWSIYPTLILNAEISEPTPLGRAEWIKFIGILVGRGAKANRIFGYIASHYEALKLVASTTEERPTVQLAEYIDGYWKIALPDGYADRLISDAGAHLASTQGTFHTDSLSSWEFAQRFRDTDFILSWEIPHIGTHKALGNKLPELQHMKAFKNKEIYLGSLLSNMLETNIYWEENWQRPDLLLQDIVFILHPELDAHKGEKTLYWKRLY